MQKAEVFGKVVGAATLVYLMAVTLIPVFTGSDIPCSSRFPLTAVFALGCALAGAVIGGTATAKGSIPWLNVQNHPLAFGVTGGVAVLVIILALGWNLYVKPCDDITPKNPNEIIMVVPDGANLQTVIAMFRRIRNVNVDVSGCPDAAKIGVQSGEIKAPSATEWLELLSYRLEGSKRFSVTTVKEGVKYAIRCQ